MSVIRSSVSKKADGTPVFHWDYGMIRPMSRVEAVWVQNGRLRRAACRQVRFLGRPMMSEADLRTFSEALVP